MIFRATQRWIVQFWLCKVAALHMDQNMNVGPPFSKFPVHGGHEKLHKDRNMLILRCSIQIFQCTAAAKITWSGMCYWEMRLFPLIFPVHGGRKKLHADRHMIL